MIEIKDASQHDVEAYYGHRPAYSMRGVVIREEDRLIGIAGIFSAQGRQYMFSEHKVDANHYKRTLIRAARRVLQLAHGKVVYAIAANNITAPGMLEHFGFELIDELQQIYMRRG